MKIFYLLIKIIILVVLLFITINNIQSVAFTWSYQQSVHVPLIVLLLIFFIVGALFGVIARSGRIFQLKMQSAKLRKELKKVQVAYDEALARAESQNVLRLEKKQDVETD